MRIVLIMKRKLLVALCLLISAIASAQNPYVGKWNVVKRVRGTEVYTAPPVQAWVEFTESTFTITYGSTHYVIASGNYHLSGTTFVYDSGNLEKANVTYFDGANNMQIHIEYYEDDTDKGGGYTLVAEDATLERDGTSGGGDTPTPEPQPIDSDIYTISGNKIYCTESYVTPSPGGLSGKGVQADDFKVVLYDRNNDKMSIEQGSSSVINFGTLDSYESYKYCLKSGGAANVELQLTFNRSGTLKVGARSQNRDDYSRGIRITQNGATILDEIVSENDIVSDTKPYIYAFHTAKVEAGSATLVPVVGAIAFYVIEFIPDATKKCAKPTISYEGGKLRFYSDTPNATFHSTITDSDIKSYDTSEIDLSVAYNVSVYATADGYDDSDVATVTLCWIDYTPTSTITQSADLNAQPVLIQSFNGVLQIQGLEVGSDVSIYNVHGQKTNAATVSGHDLTIDSNVKSGNIAIVKINNKAIKVVVK